MLQTNSASQEYVIKIISQDNPIRIQLPIVPSKVIQTQSTKVLTIDDCSFVATQPFTTGNIVIPASDFIQLMFNNGSGCFDQTGRQTKLLQVLAPVTQICDTASNITRKGWRLIGGTDPFLWTFGHDLQIGFSDVLDNAIDFKSTGLNTYYTLIIQIHLV